MNGKLLAIMGMAIILMLSVNITIAGAHMTFLQTDDKPRIIPTTQGVTVFFGHTHAPESFTTEFPHRDLRLYKADGTVEKLELKQEANYWTASITLDQMGDYIVTVAREPHIYDPMWHEHPGPVYLSQGFAKALIHGGGVESWDRVVGQGLEIVPLTDPFYLQVGDMFEARLLRDGTPVKGEYAVAHESQDIHDPEVAQTGETAEDGTFSVTITKPGMWLILCQFYAEESGVWKATYSVDHPPVTWTEGQEYAYDELRFSAALTIWAERGSLASPTLAYSALGIAIVAIAISLIAVWKRRK